MTTEVAPDLLLNQVGGLRSQNCPRSTLVGLEFVEGAFDLPPLRVRRREFDGGDFGRVDHGGEQPVRTGRRRASAVIDVVVNNADHDVFGVQPRVVRSELAEPRAVLEGLDMTGRDVVLGPLDQICFSSGRLCPQGEPGEPAIREEHHAGFEAIDQRLR